MVLLPNISDELEVAFSKVHQTTILGRMQELISTDSQINIATRPITDMVFRKVKIFLYGYDGVEYTDAVHRIFDWQVLSYRYRILNTLPYQETE